MQSSLGEGPEQYSARLVRTVEQDGSKEMVESQVAVSGEMIREDWSEGEQKRALIIRPDLGEAYLLLLDEGEFVVQAIGPRDQFPTNSGSALPHQDKAGPGTESPAGAGVESSVDPVAAVGPAAPVDPVAIDSDLSPSPSPESTTILALPNIAVDSHPCKAFERRSVFPDGTTEITKTYRAIDLSGLTIRAESESDSKDHHLRIVTERRDIQVGVAQTVFNVPAGFRRKATP